MERELQRIFNSEQTISEEGLTIEGFRESFFRKVGFYLLGFLTGGLFFLFVKWYPNVWLICTHYKSPLSTCDSVRITHVTEGVEVRKVHRSYLADGSGLVFFEYRCLRYCWSRDSFSRPKFDISLPYSEIHKRYVNLEKGLEQERADDAAGLFGYNSIVVPVRSYFHLIFNEVVHPFYLFQLASVILWMCDEYWVYALCILVMSIISAGFSVVQTRRNMQSLNAMARLHVQVELMRSGKIKENVPSDLLVPGDLIRITTGMIMPCDAVLIKGSSVMNESMLTGESLPVLKSHLPRRDEHGAKPYSPEDDNRFTLYAGTTVVQSRNNAWALVHGTGFSTSKGMLVRSILYPKPTKFKFHRDSFRFLGFLFVVAIVGFIYAVITFIQHGASAVSIFKRGADLITIVVPPGLPVAMTIGTGFSMHRLKRENIFCISPVRVNVSGRVSVMCFDKTGTLTEEGLDVLGVHPSENGTFSRMVERSGDILGKLLYAMTSCHSITVLEDTFIGDTLEVKMFQYTRWSFEEVAEDPHHPHLLSVVRSPQKEQALGIVKRFDFSSALQRMSTITYDMEEKSLVAFVKGSPEMIRQLCLPSTIPGEYTSILSTYTNQGYRVIAMAYRPLDDMALDDAEQTPRHEVEKELRFLGFFILQNKLKTDTAEYIGLLRDADIRNIMVTGDNILTAVNVSRQCNLLPPDRVAYICDAVSPTDSSKSPSPNEILLLSDLQCSPLAPIEGDIQMKPTQTVVAMDRSDLPDWFYDPSIGLALTGAAYQVLCDGDAQLLAKVILKANVYARMSPFQKADLIERLQDQNLVVGMCGDGANDCGALKAADVGLSLSEAEASVAAPFTSKSPTIRSVHTLLREGRCALVTSTQIFKFIAMYSLIQFATLLIVYSFGSVLGDFQFLYQDLVLIIPLVFFMGKTEPSKRLSKARPIGSLISIPIISSILGQVAIVFFFGVGMYLYLRGQDWYRPPPELPPNHDPKEGGNIELMATTSAFLLSNFQYLAVFTAYSISKPFRKSVFTNVYLLVSLVVLLAINVYITIWPARSLEVFMQMGHDENELWLSYRVTLLVVAAVQWGVVWFYERVIILLLANRFSK
ncbi:hypothetical protein PROFUN_05347 [Planoprotostelium fungivorum]|uniref:Cation-transporting ATPase n=1 Tax=Planoprotostelium fungivorum TaxID=1890364 RepID=A0A2P6NRC1_9EUKA|nr:hypothetical protein PROFUN_05347 [Planoprotostelium fungivorum]